MLYAACNDLNAFVQDAEPVPFQADTFNDGIRHQQVADGGSASGMYVVSLEVNVVDGAIISERLARSNAPVVPQELIAEVPGGLRCWRNGGKRPRALHAGDGCWNTQHCDTTDDDA